MIGFEELRSAVENCRYEDLAGIWPTIPSRYHRWLFAKLPWVKPHTFKALRKAIDGVLMYSNYEDIASVVYLILAGGHREHWMRYAMACLQNADHETTNAADLVWWMCSHAPDLHERILDAGHTCDEDLVWEFLAQFAYWELVRPECFGGYESPGCTAYGEDDKAVFASWPCSLCIQADERGPQEDWGMYVRTGSSERVNDLDGVGTSLWRSSAANIIETTRKAMKGDA